MTTQQNKESIVKILEEVLSKDKLQVVDELIAPQYTIRHDPGDARDGKTIDLKTYKERVKQSRQVLTDQQFISKI